MASLRSVLSSSVSWVHDYSTAVFSKGQLAPFSRAERIVRAATRAHPAWGPTLSELRTVALLCEAPSTSGDVARVLSTRLVPPAAAWRRAAKALAVVEHLATCGGPGSARVAFATANLLDDLAATFQSYDERGVDVGEGVRAHAARLAALMRNPAALEEARAVSRMVRERSKASGGGGFGGGGAGGFPRLQAPERVLALPAPAAELPEASSSSRPAAAAAAFSASRDPAHVSAAPTPVPTPPPPQPRAPVPDLLSFDDDDGGETGTAAAAAAAAAPSSSLSPATVLPQEEAAASPASPSSFDLPAAPAAIVTAPPVFSWHPVKLAPSSNANAKSATPAEALEQMLRSSVETFDGQAAAAGNGAILGGGDGRRTPPRPPPMSSAV